MTRVFDVCGKLPDDIVQALIELDAHLSAVGVPYILMGALARDVVTSLAQGATPERATKDIDLAIHVGSMEQFREATSHLPRAGNHKHKFVVAGIEVDIVPFGNVADGNMITFPDSSLDVSGLVEAARNSDLARVSETTSIHTASIAALAVLKVLAWRDRHTWTSKDAIDLAHLLTATGEAPYDDEAWQDDAAGALVDFDGSLIGCAWLGRQGSHLFDDDTRQAALTVLTAMADHLAQDMRSSLASEQLEAFTAGLQR